MNELDAALTRLPEIVAEARAHAESVARREHVKADRVARAGIFATSLRQAIDARRFPNRIAGALKDALAHPGHWSDIAVPCAFRSFRVRMDGLGRDIPAEEVRRMCAQSPPPPAEDEAIAALLRELGASVAAVNSLAADAESVNRSAESVSGMISAFADELSNP